MPETVKRTALPDANGMDVRQLLASEGIRHGDIHSEGGVLFVSVVELTPEVEGAFAERFSSDSYWLVEVEFTLEELEAAQEELYSSGLD
ncbi:hypothetical protein MO973_26340 [Paenibacillus sp. TRM 82003]|nr:hypothetical protein [Paenibacillus sp. TRM 82003]